MDALLIDQTSQNNGMSRQIHLEHTKKYTKKIHEKKKHDKQRYWLKRARKHGGIKQKTHTESMLAWIQFMSFHRPTSSLSRLHSVSIITNVSPVLRFN